MQPLDEIDLRVVEALTVRPRAPWAAVGEALGISASTAARRWEQMRAQGSAWMSCYPGPRFAEDTRILELHITCAPGGQLEAARVLQTSPAIFSLSMTAGEWDLVVNTQTNAGNAGIARLLNDPMWRHPLIRDVRLSQSTKAFSAGPDWRVGALEPSQTAGLQNRRGSRNDRVTPRTRALLTRLLQDDPRMSASLLSQHLHASIASVSRQLESLVRDGELVLRTEVSAQVDGWSTGGYLYFEVPPSSLNAVGTYVAQLPTTRLCMGVINARWNLSTVHWMNRPERLGEIEADIRQRFPEVVIASRALRVREVKRVGWLLDPEHRPTGRVPIEIED